MSDRPEPNGPDLTLGIAQEQLADGAKLLGHVGEDDVILARIGNEFFAVGAFCTHYHGPLAEGLVVEGTVRCPWHHACFDLRTGEAVRAPAFDPLSCWAVELRGDRVFVTSKKEASKPLPTPRISGDTPGRIVIVGGGAAGFAAAEVLRREGFAGSIAMLSNDTVAPVDRPNLSKDYLAGSAPEDWVPLRSESFYAENAINLRLATAVVGVDPGSREVELSDGNRIPYDRLRSGDRRRAGSPSGSLGATKRTCIRFVRLLTAARSLRAHRLRVAPSSSAPALSGLRSRLPCAPATSKSMSSRRKKRLWNVSWGRRWADSYNLSMKSTALFFISTRPPYQSQGIE